MSTLSDGSLYQFDVPNRLATHNLWQSDARLDYLPTSGFCYDASGVVTDQATFPSEHIHITPDTTSSSYHSYPNCWGRVDGEVISPSTPPHCDFSYPNITTPPTTAQTSSFSALYASPSEAIGQFHWAKERCSPAASSESHIEEYKHPPESLPAAAWCHSHREFYTSVTSNGSHIMHQEGAPPHAIVPSQQSLVDIAMRNAHPHLQMSCPGADGLYMGPLAFSEADDSPQCSEYVGAPPFYASPRASHAVPSFINLPPHLQRQLRLLRQQYYRQQCQQQQWKPQRREIKQHQNELVRPSMVEVEMPCSNPLPAWSHQNIDESVTPEQLTPVKCKSPSALSLAPHSAQACTRVHAHRPSPYPMARPDAVRRAISGE